MYPQDPRLVPAPPQEYVLPTFGAAAVNGPAHDAFQDPAQFGFAYITGGSTTLPVGWKEGYITDFSGVTVSKKVYVVNLGKFFISILVLIIV
jgi:hypothetical protein